MILREVLHEARVILSAANIDDAALESEVLLRYLLDIDRAFLITHDDTEIASDDRQAYLELVNRRKAGEPTAYIIGKKEFYGLDFMVSPAVLIPRPETELLVEAAIDRVNEQGCRSIADIGTGSGCIAIALAANLPDVAFYAVDISAEALDVARRNSRKHNVEDRITFLEGDLLKPIPEKIDMITANLPYVDLPAMDGVNTRGYEPDTALYGGPDGLDKVRELLVQAREKLTLGGSVFLEIGAGQSELLCEYLRISYPEASVTVLQDLAGIDRIVRVDISPDSRLIS